MQDDGSPEQLADTASDLVSRVLSVPLIWPKTTVLVSLSLVGLAIAAWTLTGVRPQGPPPPPNAERLAQMLNAVQRADAAVRQRAGMPVEPDPNARGVFETMRDQPPGVQPTGDRNQGDQTQSQEPSP